MQGFGGHARYTERWVQADLDGSGVGAGDREDSGCWQGEVSRIRKTWWWWIDVRQVGGGVQGAHTVNFVGVVGLLISFGIKGMQWGCKEHLHMPSGVLPQ